MTPEERRKLRQDVHQAGRDLYPERMRERRREMRRGEQAGQESALTQRR